MKKNYLFACLLFFAPLWIIAQTETFDYTGDLQTYIVPDGVGSIQISATGAAGGEGGLGVGGHGARMVGTFSVTPGETLTILVGEVGQSATYVGGGGGGTFVWNEDDELLIAAGGGGGAGHTDVGETYYDGIDASIFENGTNGNSQPDGGGTGGNGGTAPSVTYYASGGAGWLSNGNNGTTHGCASNSTGGQRPLLGGAGGSGGGSGATIAGGGYGGGGGGNARCGAVGGGGGGGYSGGGAGGELVGSRYDGGGGGGSFNDGTDQDNEAGVGTGNGQVIIEVMCSALIFEDVDLDICEGEEIILDAASETGGTVMWSDGIENGVAFIPDGAGSHTYTATSTSGSDCSFTVEVDVHGAPDIEANADPEIVCYGQELTLSGSGGASYTWEPDGIEDDEPFEPELGTHTYTVHGTDWYGCTNTDEITVMVIESPVVSASASDENICLGDEVTLTGSGAVIYEWDMDVEDGVAFVPEAVGTYTYTVTGWTEEDGCSGEAMIEVTVNELPTIDGTSSTDELLGDDGTIDIDVSGGTAPYSFDWDIDGTGDYDDDEDPTGVAGGTYNVIVMDDNGCMATESVTVNSQVGIADQTKIELRAFPNPTSDKLNILTDGAFNYTVQTITGALLFTGVSTNQATIDLTSVANGIYILTVYSADGEAKLKISKK